MRQIALAVCVTVASSGALAANWSISKNEQDPFDKDRATFVASTTEGGKTLAVRCLEGELSFAVFLDPGSVTAGDEVQVRIVADGKDPTSATGGVLAASVYAVGIQFGGAEVMDYLQGAKKYYLRLSGGSASLTFGFTGGRSFDDVMNRARKACGEAQTSPPAPTPSPTHSVAAPISPKWANRDCSREVSCSTQFACLTGRHELGEDVDADGYLGWCRQQPNMKQ